ATGGHHHRAGGHPPVRDADRHPWPGVSFMTLSITELSVCYRRRRVLDRLSLTPIAARSLVAVIGPYAVGKSTLWTSTAGPVLRQGSVYLKDLDLALLPPAQRVRLLGYLPQTLPQPTTLVAYETVFSACRAVRHDLSARQVEEAIETVFRTLELEALAFR